MFHRKEGSLARPVKVQRPLRIGMGGGGEDPDLLAMIAFDLASDIRLFWVARLCRAYKRRPTTARGQPQAPRSTSRADIWPFRAGHLPRTRRPRLPGFEFADGPRCLVAQTNRCEVIDPAT